MSIDMENDYGVTAVRSHSHQNNACVCTLHGFCLSKVTVLERVFGYSLSEWDPAHDKRAGDNTNTSNVDNVNNLSLTSNIVPDDRAFGSSRASMAALTEILSLSSAADDNKTNAFNSPRCNGRWHLIWTRENVIKKARIAMWSFQLRPSKLAWAKAFYHHWQASCDSNKQQSPPILGNCTNITAAAA